MFSQEKINRLLIILTCVILMSGLYYEHYMLKLKAGLKREEKQIAQKQLALQSHVRRSMTTANKTDSNSDDNMISLKIRPGASGKNISLSLHGQRRLPRLSSSLRAFKKYAGSLENITEDEQ